MDFVLLYSVIGLEYSGYLLKFQSKTGHSCFPVLHLRFRQFVPCYFEFSLAPGYISHCSDCPL